MADLNIQDVLNQAEAARKARVASQAEADKAAKEKRISRDAKMAADNKFNYANTIDQSRTEFEGKLRMYATKMSRGDKLTAVEQKDFNGVLSQYNKTNAAFNKAVDEGNAILAKAPNAPVTDANKKANSGKSADAATPPQGETVITDPKTAWANNFTIQNGVVTDGTGPAYVYTIPAQPGARPGSMGEPTTASTSSVVAARDAFIKNYYGKEGGINALKQQLLTGNWIKSSDLAGDSWLNGVDDMIKSYSQHVITQVKYDGVKTPDTIDQYFSKTKAAGTGGGPKQYRTITTRGDAVKYLNNYLNDLIGRASTPQEQEEFYNKLHVAENKAVRTVSNGTTTGSELSQTDYQMIATEVARKSLKGTNIDTLLSSKKGSQVATDIAALQKTAADYGLPMTAADALKHVADGLGQQDYLKKQQERLRLNAIQVHPYLAAHIQAGGTVKDVADVYAYTRQKKLGIVIPDSTQDKNVMAAVASGKNVAQYEQDLQADPLWAKTDEANNIAADFTQTILRSFGFGG